MELRTQIIKRSNTAATRSDATRGGQRFLRRHRRLAGFTLAESLIAAVVLAISTVGVTVAINASYQQTESLEQTTTSLGLGRQLMEDITALPYDSIASWDGYTDESTSMPTNAQTTRDVTDGLVFTRSVSVAYRASLTGPEVSTGDFATVTVRIIASDGQTIELSQLVTRLSMKLQ